MSNRTVRRTANGPFDPDTLARLEEERRFLMRSLTDIEREFEAGDVERSYYEVLRDGYTARAAAVLRAIDDGVSSLPPRRQTPRRIVAVWVTAVVALGVLSGWLVANQSGERAPGQVMTGGVEADEVGLLLTEARGLMSAGNLGEAFDRFRKVTEIEPDNVEARTYSAWMLALSAAGMEAGPDRTAALDAALLGLDGVISYDPVYADAQCLSVVIAVRFVDPPDVDLAAQRAAGCRASNPPAEMLGLVGPLLDEVDPQP